MTNILNDALFQQHIDSERPFLIRQDGVVQTYGCFFRRAAQCGHVFRKAGVKPGDRIMVLVEKSTDMLALYAAAVQSGAVFLPLNPAYTDSEVAYFVGDSKPKLLICDPARSLGIEPLAAQADAVMMTLSDHGSGSLCDAADQMPSHPNISARKGNDLAALLYTSGTTGRSKGAMISHANLVSNAQTLMHQWQITSDDVLLHALPIFHTHGLFVAGNTCLAAGASMLFHPRFDATRIIADLPKATLMMGVPTFYTRLLSHAALDQDVTRKMRLFISGSAPLLAETHELFAARTGHEILERYGMTETNMITTNPVDGTRKPGTVGSPLNGVEVRITEQGSDQPVPHGEIGMIQVRGPNVFQGYWKMPEKTDAELRKDGYFITGDLGRFDQDGYLEIVGRQKDLIISGGFNVYPKEIEDALNELPGVLETAVFGVPDPDFGEAVAAAIVCNKPNSDAGGDIKSAIAEKLAAFKRPKTYLFLDALPRNAMGKVQKNLLRESI